jgi:uncharacterized MAPEG superfamily protein
MHLSFANLAARPIVALFAFAAWTMLLVASIATVRVIQVLTKRVPANGFTSGVPHGSDAYWRLNRAHANALENLVVFAVLVLGGAALGVSTPRIALLSEIVVIARIAQSCFHVASGKSWVVNLRFTAFVTQIVCFVLILASTLRELT